MRKAKVIAAEDVALEKTYESPLTAKRGISSDTVEHPMMTITHYSLPPGARCRRKFHVNCDTGMHLLKGRIKMVFGPSHKMEEYIIEPGDFVFTPKGEIYGVSNCSDQEPAEWVTNKAIVGNVNDEGTVLVEPPWK